MLINAKKTMMSIHFTNITAVNFLCAYVLTWNVLMTMFHLPLYTFTDNSSWTLHFHFYFALCNVDFTKARTPSTLQPWGLPGTLILRFTQNSTLPPPFSLALTIPWRGGGRWPEEAAAVGGPFYCVASFD